MSPVARADIVAFTDMESPGRSKKSVDGANFIALFAPAENERLIIRVGQPATTADSSLNIRGERVVGDRDGGRHGEQRTAKKVYLSLNDPDQAVHVHHHRVLTCGQDLSTRPFCLISRVEQKLIHVRDAGFGRNPGVGCAHTKRVDTPDLGQGGQSNYADGSQQTKWDGPQAGKTSRHKPRRAPSAADCSKDWSFESL